MLLQIFDKERFISDQSWEINDCIRNNALRINVRGEIVTIITVICEKTEAWKSIFLNYLSYVV